MDNSPYVDVLDSLKRQKIIALLQKIDSILEELEEIDESINAQQQILREEIKKYRTMNR